MVFFVFVVRSGVSIFFTDERVDLPHLKKMNPTLDVLCREGDLSLLSRLFGCWNLPLCSSSECPIPAPVPHVVNDDGFVWQFQERHGRDVGRGSPKRDGRGNINASIVPSNGIDAFGCDFPNVVCIVIYNIAPLMPM